MRTAILLLAGSLWATGCVGGIDGGGDDGGGDDGGGDDGGGTGEAKRMYEETVFPIMTAKCGAGCHLVGSSTSTSFVATGVADAWITMTGYTSVVGNFTTTGAPVWFRIMNENHNARTYTTDEQAAISAWLAQEVTERTTNPNPDPNPTETPAQISQRLISEWSGCLKLEDFVELRFGEAWANKGSDEGNCENCHESGYYGMLANDDNAYMYEVLSTNKNYMLTFFKANVVDLANPSMLVNETTFDTVGRAVPPHTEHPEFDARQITGVTGTAPLDVLDELYNRTMGYKTAGTCGPPRITQ